MLGNSTSNSIVYW